MSITKIRVGAVFVGWVTTLFLFLIMAAAAGAYFVTSGGLSALLSASQQAVQYPSVSLNVVIFVAIFVAFFIGGYVAGRMAAFAGAMNGGMLVVTALVTISFGILFASVVETRLGFDLLTPATQAIAPYGFKIFTGFAFALLGSLLGGRYGEGYVDRLDLTLNVTKPMPNKHKKAQDAPAKPQQPKVKHSQPTPQVDEAKKKAS